VGCANQSHFSALFHRATGMTPLTYRIQNRPRASLPPQVRDIRRPKRGASLPESERRTS
jgi:AraC-like DNA-binding protein